MADLLSYAGWYFLPNLVTGYLQSALYTITIRAGDPKPPPNSPRYARDRRRIYILVILAYLLYTLYEADWRLRQDGDFYQSLGVGHGVEEKGVGREFRRLTKQFHPDKLPPGADSSATSSHYLHLQLARSTLENPTTRFAYDRFGPAILTCRSCSSIRDFVFAGLQSTALYYAASLAFLILLSVLGYLREARFWRYAALGAMFALEVAVVTRPRFPVWLTSGVNPFLRVVSAGRHAELLPWQVLALLRKGGVAFFIAVTQLAPFVRGPEASRKGEDGEAKLVERVEGLGRALDMEVGRLLGLEFSPFVGGEVGMRDLRDGLREWLVGNTLRNDAEVKGAIGKVLERRRVGGGGDDGGGG